MDIKIVHPLQQKELHKNEKGHLTDGQGIEIAFENGVHIFSGEQNYTASFGFQWNAFQATQIDKDDAKTAQSADRFKAVTHWHEQDLNGKHILEVGSGAGRFTHAALRYTKAHIHSVDFSSAVFANFRNNGPHERLTIYKASIYELPFTHSQFDKVFCFGVLQHTPDFKRSVKSLVQMVKPGGELIVDFYPIRGWHTKLHAKYLFRPFTKKMSHEKLLRVVENNADWMIGFTQRMTAWGIGKWVNRFVPVCDIAATMPAGISPAELRERVVLDTFDMFSPEHDHPQRISTVAKWMADAGLDITHAGMLHYGPERLEVAVVKGTKPAGQARPAQ